ncbi:MAG: methyltransferase domain-containing protein [Phycisphaerales bacterium]
MTQHAAARPSYVLGVNQAELDRLGLQHQLWASRTSALWERANIRQGHAVLDIGCGPGFATFDLARLVGPTGSVVAVDEAEMFVNFLRQRAAESHHEHIAAHHGDVQDLRSLLGEAPRFDAAYARWVLCFVPDPEAVVAQTAALLKPGGRLIVQDYFNYRSMSLAPKCAVFDRIIAAVERSWRDRGGDPDIGGRLPAMMRRAGMTVREITPQLRVARPGETLWAWPDTFFRNFVPVLEETGYITADERAAFQQEWARASADPDAFKYTPPVVEIIAIKDK